MTGALKASSKGVMMDIAVIEKTERMPITDPVHGVHG